VRAAPLAARRIPRLFTEQHRIEVIVNTRNVEPVTETYADPFMAPLLYTDFFALTQSRRDIDRLEAASGQAVYSLQTFLRALDTVIEQGITQRGWVGIKWHKIPYLRPPTMEPRTPGPPRSGWSASCACLPEGTRLGYPAGVDEMRRFRTTSSTTWFSRPSNGTWRSRFTRQLGSSQGAQVANTRPSHLVDLFLQYPRARFDLLHGSFPYSGELGALTQLFANVYINMSWMESSPRRRRNDT